MSYRLTGEKSQRTTLSFNWNCNQFGRFMQKNVSEFEFTMNLHHPEQHLTIIIILLLWNLVKKIKSFNISIGWVLSLLSDAQRHLWMKLSKHISSVFIIRWIIIQILFEIRVKRIRIKNEEKDSKLLISKEYLYLKIETIKVKKDSIDVIVEKMQNLPDSAIWRNIIEGLQRYNKWSST